MADKPFMCPNCNGMGPFLVLQTVNRVDRMGVTDPDFPIPLQTFYMCQSSDSTEGSTGCMMVSTLEELTR